MKGKFLVGLLLFLMPVNILFAQEQNELDQHLSYYQYDEDILPASFHQERREALRALMAKNSAAVFFAAPERKRSNDIYYPYHQDPNFYYLSGIREPKALLIIYKEKQKFGKEWLDEILLVQDRNPHSELWNGRILGVEGAKALTTFKKVMRIDEFLDFDPKFKNLNRIFYTPAEGITQGDTTKTDNLWGLIHHFEKKLTENNQKDEKHLLMMMAELREVKTEEELTLIRKAIAITCEAQNELMRQINENMHEYETQALVEYVFKKNGAEHPAFLTIHGSGENSTILHYTTNRRPLKNGGLLVSDIGAEYRGYAADVTRTIPPTGKFTKEQAEIYNLVLKAQQAGIDAAVIGSSIVDINKAAQEVIAKGLKNLGIIKSKKEVRKYFMHGTSHYLGLDVHDVGTYSSLKENNVITVEPGIYIAEGSDCDKKWWNIGVRIEDDILIAKEGPEILSNSSPRSIEAIEKLMAK